ncbi:hypothetical protein KI387_037511 [Taxus chinensis]|uniref:DUF659 domain-containing protein n=1 Tax=Taxus chinensis TaxID=29808 RepID=A0AA38FSE1_TAXCH|nr:hypothetical protein KI387_037511 [Taxus chinensis]
MPIENQPTLDNHWKKQYKEATFECIARWWYDADIPFNAARSPYYQLMFDSIVVVGKGFKGPSMHDLRGSLLKKEVVSIDEYLKRCKTSWAKTGCTIMSDGWSDGKNRTIINFLASCLQGTMFSKSVDASDRVKYANLLFELLDEIVIEVGVENVVQIITDNVTMFLLVLDLMVRMLGFSEEDKQRIGLAQQGASKGVVRGVLGFPGRLVGGIMGSGSSQISPPSPSDNQSFADLWVDFLLKESEERERRENGETKDKGGVSRQGQEIVSGASRAVTASETSTSSSVRDDITQKSPSGAREKIHSTGGFSNFPMTYSTAEQPLRTHISRENHWSDPADTEFSTVPLNSALSPTPQSNIQHSRIIPRP